MKNIRKVQFFGCYVEARRWSAIVALPSLEVLSFYTCVFLRYHAGLEPEQIQSLKLQVSRLSWLDAFSF